MARTITPKQRAALAALTRTTPRHGARHVDLLVAGAPAGWSDNENAFLRRLLDAGLIDVVLTDRGRDALRRGGE